MRQALEVGRTSRSAAGLLAGQSATVGILACISHMLPADVAQALVPAVSRLVSTPVRRAATVSDGSVGMSACAASFDPNTREKCGLDTKRLISIAALVVLAACNRVTPNLEKAPTPVRVEPVEMFTPTTGERYSASMLPDRQVTLSFRVGGFVESVFQVSGRNVDIGDVVPQGTVLAAIRTQEYQFAVAQTTSQVQQARQSQQTAQAQLAQAQAGAAKAALDFQRAEALLAGKALTKPDYDSAKAQYDATRAQVQAAQSQIQASADAVTTAEASVGNANLNLHDTALTAPFEAVLVQRNVEIGALAAPGAAAFVLADLASVRASFGVPDTVVVSLKPGVKLSLIAEAIPTRAFQGTVTNIAAVADSATRLFQVEVTIPNQNRLLRPGMIAALSLSSAAKAEPVPVVSLNAIVRAADKSGFAVMVVEGKRARRRAVTLGQTYGDRVAVSGVKTGEQVIGSGAALIADGDAVEVIP